MRRLGVAFAAVLLAACQTSTAPQPTPSPVARTSVQPSPSAAPATSGPIAVYDGPTLDGKGHVVYLVGVGSYGTPDCQPDCSFAASETAKVLATAEAAGRTAPGKAAFLPEVSVSAHRIYFLDGNSRIRAVGADGKVSDVAELPVSPADVAVFAVNADDTQMAVALIHNTSETLYVATPKGSNRSDIFTSTGPLYWPVGWHGGKVVLGTGADFQNLTNQYVASGYALVDPVSGAQPSRVGPGDCVPTGTLTPAGFACVVNPGTTCLGPALGTSGSSTYYSSCLRRVDWTGKETTFVVTSYEGIGDLVVHHAALSPDGHVIATDGLFWVGEPNAGGYPGFVNGFTTSVPFNVMPPQPGIGFVDPYHVSFMFVNTQTGLSYQRMYSFGSGYGAFKNVYFMGEPSTSFVPGGSIVGALMGTLPGGL